MPTREHVVEATFAAAPARVFEALVTPSAIRVWWGAARVIVLGRAGGTWAAAWGADEDDPDYVTCATLRVFDPPRRLLFTDFQYFARTGPLPFEASLTTEYTVEPGDNGTRLTIRQAGFPADPAADDFYAACERGWRDTLAALRRFLDH
jgi:uncharacterized protein YndB with AHSA1/START domain